MHPTKLITKLVYFYGWQYIFVRIFTLVKLYFYRISKKISNLPSSDIKNKPISGQKKFYS